MTPPRRRKRFIPVAEPLLTHPNIVTIVTNCGGFPRENGQPQDERGPARFRLEPEGAAHPLRQLPRDCQAEPAAGRPRPLEPREACEHLLVVLGRNTLP